VQQWQAVQHRPTAYSAPPAERLMLFNGYLRSPRQAGEAAGGAAAASAAVSPTSPAGAASGPRPAPHTSPPSTAVADVPSAQGGLGRPQAAAGVGVDRPLEPSVLPQPAAASSARYGGDGSVALGDWLSNENVVVSSMDDGAALLFQFRPSAGAGGAHASTGGAGNSGGSGAEGVEQRTAAAQQVAQARGPTARAAYRRPGGQCLQVALRAGAGRALCMGGA
jgi:translation initiation factor IF-2